MNNYIIVGDSITYGIGDSTGNGWASLFKEEIKNIDDTITSTIENLKSFVSNIMLNTYH